MLRPAPREVVAPAATAMPLPEPVMEFVKALELPTVPPEALLLSPKAELKPPQATLLTPKAESLLLVAVFM